MRGRSGTERRRGFGPFSGTQLTIMFVALVVGVVAYPVVADAANAVFTNNSASVAAVRATNSNAKGIGVAGAGKRYGVFSNGPLGVAAGQPLSCTGCVGAGAISSTIATDAWSRTAVVEDVNLSKNIVSVTVPAGRYLLQWDAQGETDAASTQTLVCGVDTPNSELPERATNLVPIPGEFAYGSVSYTGKLQTTSTGPLVLRCGNGDVTGALEVTGDLSLTRLVHLH